MFTTMWQRSLTKHLANAMATVWPLRQRHSVPSLEATTQKTNDRNVPWL